MPTDGHTFVLKNSRGQPCSFVLHQCRAGDLSAIAALQDEVSAALKQAHIFEKTPAEQIEESLCEDFCLGVFCEDTLAAAAIMVVNRVTPRNLGVHLGYDEERLVRCASYDSVFVLPEFRGYGLQRLLFGAMEERAAGLGCDEALATVSPDNSVSLGNMMTNGFEIVTEKVMYSGVRRYIVRKELRKR